MAPQAADNVKDRQLRLAGRPGELGDTSSKIFRGIGMRKFPLFVQPQTDREWFDLFAPYGTFPMRCSSQRGRLRYVHPSLGLCWSVTERNLHRCRWRWPRKRVSPFSETMDSISLDDGSAHQLNADD